MEASSRFLPKFREIIWGNDEMNPLVADLSHHNWDRAPLDLARAKAAGLVGVIYKATEGATYQDPFYATTRTAAKKAGLLWGAYHFATAAPAKGQADNFLKASTPDKDTLVALDFEHNDPNPGNTTNAAIALDVLARIENAVGRKPTLYTGQFMFDLFGGKAQPKFAPYRLWWARYRATPDIHPTWSKYWLWQYTSGTSGPTPRQIAGIGPCDCNDYQGSAAQLKAEWV